MFPGKCRISIRHLTFHDLRGTAVVTLVRAGCSSVEEHSAFRCKCSMTESNEIGLAALEMMKGDFGKAVDAHGHDGRSGTDRRISDHIVILPSARSETPHDTRSPASTNWDHVTADIVGATGYKD
jgi:hypothetical protein